MPDSSYQWRGLFENEELNELHADAFQHQLESTDWQARTSNFSLGWITARHGPVLVGFVNVIWDGGAHAFLLDLVVRSGHQRRGVGSKIVLQARARARDARCQWLHVDFESPLRRFYIDACGFESSAAGVLRL